METYFIRHPRKKIALDDKTRERMWKEQRIFIHFDDKSGNERADSRSINPDDYEGSAKKAMTALCRLALDGGYVCGHFDDHEEWLMGKVLPKSQIELRKGKWPEELFKKPKKHDGIIVIKTLRLHKVRPVRPENYAILQPAQPRQGTIVCWPSIGDTIEAIVERKKIRRSLNALSPNHQEMMCAEFLRQRIATHFGLPQLDCLLCDVGRTMKDLDIFGLATDGRKIFAQVTHDSLEQAMWKLKALQKFKKGGRGHLVLFCDCGKQEHQNSVMIFPIREVYRSFVATPTGKRWLRNIFPTT